MHMSGATLRSTNTVETIQPRRLLQSRQSLIIAIIITKTMTTTRVILAGRLVGHVNGF